MSDWMYDIINELSKDELQTLVMMRRRDIIYWMKKQIRANINQNTNEKISANKTLVVDDTFIKETIIHLRTLYYDMLQNPNQY